MRLISLEAEKEADYEAKLDTNEFRWVHVGLEEKDFTFKVEPRIRALRRASVRPPNECGRELRLFGVKRRN